MTVVIRDAASGNWRLFERPVEIVTAKSIDEVLPALRTIEMECNARARYAAGFISYEAAPAFDRALTTRPPDDFPLLWFGLYDVAEERSLEDLSASPPGTAGDKPKPIEEEAWRPSLSAAQYAGAFDALQELIRSGDTYQVNFTYRLRSRLRSDPFALFLQLAAAQRPPFGAYVDTGAWILCSASPELFFHRRGSLI